MLTRAMKERIRQLDNGIFTMCETYGQLGKLFCGNKNAKPEELLQAAEQVKNRVQELERQNAAMLHDMVHVVPGEICDACIHAQGEAQCEKHDFDCDKCPVDCPCKTCHGDHPNFIWRGVCAQNTKEETTT